MSSKDTLPDPAILINLINLINPNAVFVPNSWVNQWVNQPLASDILIAYWVNQVNEVNHLLGVYPYHSYILGDSNV